jgi:hypothetical protein
MIIIDFLVHGWDTVLTLAPAEFNSAEIVFTRTSMSSAIFFALSFKTDLYSSNYSVLRRETFACLSNLQLECFRTQSMGNFRLASMGAQ